MAQLNKYTTQVLNDLKSGVKHNKLSLEKLALKFNIVDKNQVKEFTELAIVMRARELANQPKKSNLQKYADIVALYYQQANLSHRTSQSMLLQQYSTPVPIGYLMGLYCGVDKYNDDAEHKKYWLQNKTKWYTMAFEPCAGNGALTIAGEPKFFNVNELDAIRNKNLEQQGFATIGKQDATDKMFSLGKEKLFAAVLANPPFGTLDKAIDFDGFKINVLDHLICINALQTMANDGKAALIIGGHTTWDNQGRIQAGKNRMFFAYLYKHYNVEDVINIDGHKLYSRNGTSFNTRLILINGRKETPSGYPPLFDKNHDKVATTFDDLYNRVLPPNNDTNIYEIEAEALSLELELLNIDTLGTEKKISYDRKIKFIRTNISSVSKSIEKKLSGLKIEFKKDVAKTGSIYFEFNYENILCELRLANHSKSYTHKSQIEEQTGVTYSEWNDESEKTLSIDASILGLKTKDVFEILNYFNLLISKRELNRNKLNVLFNNFELMYGSNYYIIYNEFLNIISEKSNDYITVFFNTVYSNAKDTNEYLEFKKIKQTENELKNYLSFSQYTAQNNVIIQTKNSKNQYGWIFVYDHIPNTTGKSNKNKRNALIEEAKNELLQKIKTI